MWSYWIGMRIQRLRRTISRVDAVAIAHPPEHSTLEARVERRWRQASVAVDAETDDPGTGHNGRHRLVRWDGWSTEGWLARPAASRPREPRALTGDACDAVAVDPQLPAANLLGLRTRRIMDARVV